MFDKIKRWYQQGLWTAKMVADAVKRGILTTEQYDEITS